MSLEEENETGKEVVQYARKKFAAPALVQVASQGSVVSRTALPVGSWVVMYRLRRGRLLTGTLLDMFRCAVASDDD